MTPVGYADIRLNVDSGGRLGPELVEAVLRTCERAEDAGADPIVLVQISPLRTVRDTAAPGEVGIHLVNRWERALRRLERVPAATICVADGECATPALEVLLTTDHRFAARDFRIGMGGPTWPGMAIHRLANQLGVATARRLVLAADQLTADRAERLGIVDEVADDPAVPAAAQARSLRGIAGRELAIRRRLLLDATSTSFEDALGAHLAACDRTLRAGPLARGEAARP